MLYYNSGNIIPPNTIAESDDTDFVNCFLILNSCNLQKYLLEYFDKSIVENNNIIKKYKRKFLNNVWKYKLMTFHKKPLVILEEMVLLGMVLSEGMVLLLTMIL